MKEFEDDFPYIETPDQISSFNDIRKDLSLIKPMNRVLCEFDGAHWNIKRLAP